MRIGIHFRTLKRILIL